MIEVAVVVVGPQEGYNEDDEEDSDETRVAFVLRFFDSEVIKRDLCTK